MRIQGRIDIRSAKRRILILGFTALVLASLAEACHAFSEMAENQAVEKDLSQKDWVGDAAYILSPGDDHGNWTRFVSIKEAGNDSSAEPSRELNGPPGVIFQSWRGFALKGNESHMMKVSIESLRPVEAMNIRKLMASDMTLEEIRTEISKEEGDVTYRGILRIGDDIYRLDNISITPTENKTDLNADVSESNFGSAQNNTSIILGHLKASLIEEGGKEVSEGVLLMKSGKDVGNYRVLLDPRPWKGELRGWGPGPEVPKRDIKAELIHLRKAA
jgi:hypothetical protein